MQHDRQPAFIVTGGLGFIGQHLVSELLNVHPRGLVHVVDRRGDVTRGSALFEEGDRVVVSRQAISDHLVEAESVRSIFHLASIVGPVGVLHPKASLMTPILEDTEATMSWARRFGARLVYASSSEIFGSPGSHSEGQACRVDVDRPSPRTEYAVGKIASEIAIRNQKRGPFPYHIVRPFNVAGPGQLPDNGFVLPRFVIQALGGMPLSVYGDGRQVRAFTDVRDAVRAMILIEGIDRSDTWNLGNVANRCSILELAEQVIDVVGRGCIHHVDPKRLHGQQFSEANDKVPDSSKLLSETCWKPRYPLRQTIQDTVEFWSGHRMLDRYRSKMQDEVALLR